MIKELFQKWANSVEVGSSKIAFGWSVISDWGQEIRPDDIFGSFNYTETLERIYEVPDSQVYHIHGDRRRDRDLIVGHGDDESRDFSTEHILAADLLEEVIRNLRKDTDAVIRENRDLWQKIKDANITEVYSFGFSFNDVDIPYISRISQMFAGRPDIVWYLNQRDHGDENDKFKQIIR